MCGKKDRGLNRDRDPLTSRACGSFAFGLGFQSLFYGGMVGLKRDISFVY